MRDHPVRGEEPSGDLRGSSDKSQPLDDFWSIEGNYIYRHHVEPRVQLCVPKEETFPIPLRYIDVVRTTHTTLDLLQESRIDDQWNTGSNRNISGPWTGFSQFTILKEKPLDENMWSGVRLTKIHATTRLDQLWPEIWSSMSKAAQRNESSNGQSKNRSSTMLES